MGCEGGLLFSLDAHSVTFFLICLFCHEHVIHLQIKHSSQFPCYFIYCLLYFKRVVTYMFDLKNYIFHKFSPNYPL